MRCRAAAFLAVFALIAAARDASAYCRATTCDTSGVRCDPPTAEDCGEPLRWKRSCIGVSVQEDGTSQLVRKDVRGALLAAFAAWETADCGGTTPSLHVEDLSYIACGRIEYNSNGGNANAIIFRDGKWPHTSGPHNIALTTVTFDTGTGEIFDADIEVNTFQYSVTLSDTTNDYDLLSVLTHEAGHFLGLAHTPSTDATMFSVYPSGSVDFRSLSPDDTNAICAAYPPADTPSECNPIPRHGFASECAAEQPGGTCATASRPSEDRFPFALATLAAAFAFARRRRR